MQPECPGQQALPLWPKLHHCLVCENDRLALGHSMNDLVGSEPLSVDDLLQHLGNCKTGEFADEWPEPF